MTAKQFMATPVQIAAVYDNAAMTAVSTAHLLAMEATARTSQLAWEMLEALCRAEAVWGSTMVGDGADGETMASIRTAIGKVRPLT